MSFCPECCGMCDVKHIQLRQKNFDDVCYFECPRCSKVFKLVALDPEDKFEGEIIKEVHKREEIFP